jgi:hypothetical protein
MPRLKHSGGEPRTERPHIPGYGISKSKTGMLPWKWAAKTLTKSREYWRLRQLSICGGPSMHSALQREAGRKCGSCVDFQSCCFLFSSSSLSVSRLFSSA